MSFVRAMGAFAASARRAFSASVPAFAAADAGPWGRLQVRGMAMEERGGGHRASCVQQ